MINQSALGQVHDRDAFAAYVAVISGELAVAARQHGLEALGYLLEMVHMEAKTVTCGVQVSGSEKPKIAHGY
ncbi:MAG TPA: hypothetical protein VNL39_07790 [Xanthobacteraceae bacterium]|nr:hypothetical protein [Xanthobacteraceae bacterium]